MKRKKNGFTLIELVIVVAIIGILALLVIPQFTKTTERAAASRFKYNCKVVNSAMMAYSARTGGGFPPKASVLDPNIEGGWKSLVSSDTKNAKYKYDGGGDPVFHATYADSSVSLTYSIGADGSVKTEGDW